MSYAHIDNLYRLRELFNILKNVIAMEKVHGTSAHVKFTKNSPDKKFLHYFSGGENYTNFVKIFDEEALTSKFVEYGCEDCIVYGEAYGGKCQKMSETYGKELRFIAFDVFKDGKWLDIESAARFVQHLGLEFVPYRIIPMTVEALDAERDRPSEVAERRGCGTDKQREGVVIRPLIELVDGHGHRIVAKHKGEKFQERKSQPNLSDEKTAVMDNANMIADEWVVEERMSHVLDKLPSDISVESTKLVIDAMIEDVMRESKGEVVDNPIVRRAIGVKAAKMFKMRLTSAIKKFVG